jgi:chromate transport protein ChrA
MKPIKEEIMTVVLTLIARFLVRMTITVIWALILSKLIRSAWSFVKKHVRWERGNKVVVTEV